LLLEFIFSVIRVIIEKGVSLQAKETNNVMKTMQSPLKREQLAGQLQLLGYRDKLAIYKSLRKSLFQERFTNLLSSLRTEELSTEDITAAVEEVRQERYANKKQNI
jgi:hypothetical protein